jgi:hypothetical protein
LVVHTGEPTRIVEYAASGVATGRSIGRSGGGPGEFRHIRYLRVTGDTLFAYDWVRARMVRFHASSFALIGESSLPAHSHSIQLRSGRTVGTGSIETIKSIGFPLHLFSADGGVERSFGVSERLPPNTPANRQIRRLAASPRDDSFWNAPPSEYRLERWTAKGEIAETLEQSRPWFALPAANAGRASATAPATNVTGIRTGDDGNLWVLLHRPHERWRDAVERSANPEGQPSIRADRPYLVAVLEVIEASSGSLIASLDFDVGYWGILPDGRLWRTWTDEQSGEPRIELTQMELRARR